MARINKKTRIKGLPPKILLSEIDSKSRNSNTFFDDLGTINFVSSTINLGSQVSNDILNQESYQSLGQDISSSLTAPGVIRKGVGDSFIDYSDTDVISPYVDYNQFAADGKSSQSSYYSTGSIVSEAGEGFDEPLWAKDKIEIDISSQFINTHKTFVSFSNSQSMTPGSEHFGKHYNMCYYNFANKCWDGIGTGVPFGNTSLYPYSTIGFTPGLLNYRGSFLFSNPKVPYSITASFEQMTAAGNPTTTFGFPFHPKFHATSSQIYTLNQDITDPFLAEKVVIYLSAAFSYYPEIYTTSSYFIPTFVSELLETTLPACINNIFLLNQIKSAPLKSFRNTDLTASYPSNILLTATNDFEIVESSRDLLTWGGITSFGNNIPLTATRGSGSYKLTAAEPQTRTENPKELMTRDYNFSSSLDVINNLVNLSWTGSIKLELSIKNPIKLESNKNMGRIDFGGKNVSATTTKTLRAESGTKNGFSIIKPTGRDLISPISVLDLMEESEEESASTVLVSKDAYSKNNPYILFPGDQLVLGWQQPVMSNQINSGSDAGSSNLAFNMRTGNLSEISFLPGEAKMIIYGSYIKEGKEYHKPTNQYLTSNIIHQIIGDE